MPSSDDEARESDGPFVADFIEACCRVTKGPGAGDLIVLRPWQRDLLDDLFVLRPDGHRQHRRGLVGLPRKNGKSALGAGIALWSLIASGEIGGEVYSCAGDRDQARIVFAMAKQMVEMEPALAKRVKVYKDVLEFGQTHSIYKALSAEAYTKEGLNPSCVIFDEVHVQPNRELWDVMNLGSGTRADPLVLGITTAGVKSDQTGGDSICYQQYQHGKRVIAGEVEDPSFFFRWWEPGAVDADWRDPAVWAEANPAFGDFLREEDFESSVQTTPENEFRTKRLNQWVSSTQAWFPQGAWDELADEDRGLPPDGTPIVIGFDGSYNNDSTGLVGCTVEEVPHLFLIGAWEKIDHPEPDWQVPRGEVLEEIRKACRKWKVREVAMDPYRWEREMQELEEEGWPIVEWPTSSPARMVPACAKFYDAATQARLSHDGNERLGRHIENAVLKVDGKGPRIVKDHKWSPRKIDLAVCAVVAHDRASQIIPADPEPEIMFAYTDL